MSCLTNPTIGGNGTPNLALGKLCFLLVPDIVGVVMAVPTTALNFVSEFKISLMYIITKKYHLVNNYFSVVKVYLSIFF